jgi:rod shape-determining protein MreC
MEHLMGRYRNVSILAAAIFIQIVGLAVQVKRSAENQSSRLIRVWAVSAVTPFEKTIVRFQAGASDLWHNYFYLRGVRQENRELRDQIEQLQLQQVRLRQDAEQARRLQALLGFKEQFIAKTLAAQVIGSSGSEQSRTVYIDKGSREGIQPEMAVISASGVVGKVINVYRGTAQVLLINDQQSGVGAILEKSRLQGVLKGKPSGELVIDKIMADEDVKQGDAVLTSGGDQIFPKGLMIGTIAKIQRGPDFLQLTVKPSAALNHLEEVLVIVKKEEREPASSVAAMRASDLLAERLPSVPDKPPAPAVPPGQRVAQRSVTTPTGNAQGVPNKAANPSLVKPAVTTQPNAPKILAPASDVTIYTKPRTTPSAQNLNSSAPTATKPASATAPAQPEPQSSGDSPQ